MSDFLFDEFDSVSAHAWKQKIQVDLKGADYNETLLWHTNEGITVKPFYHSEDAVKALNTSRENWSIGEPIEVVNENEANKRALDALNRGAESVVYIIHTIVSVEDLLQDIKKDIPVYFIFHVIDVVSLTAIESTQNKNRIALLDPIGQLAKEGNWFNSRTEDLNVIRPFLQSGVLSLAIQIDTYQNAGATIVQQVAYAVAHLNEYLHTFQTEKTLSVWFISAVGSNYFFEIAKTRALRVLVNTVSNVYQDVNVTSHVLAIPSLRNKTIYDYNVNMLRTTTECMSAVLGGADVVCNLPYDFIYHNANEFGTRISRNQLLVLKSESAFDLVQNPADGSYYIESLTEQIAEKALTVFKQIEAGGGVISQLIDGVIQRKIKESAAKEEAQFANGGLVLLGTNKYPNPKDKMKHDLEKQPFLQYKERKTLIEPIVAKRLSEVADAQRLKEESN